MEHPSSLLFHTGLAAAGTLVITPRKVKQYSVYPEFNGPN
jgi:hypothetical protein